MSSDYPVPAPRRPVIYQTVDDDPFRSQTISDWLFAHRGASGFKWKANLCYDDSGSLRAAVLPSGRGLHIALAPLGLEQTAYRYFSSTKAAKAWCISRLNKYRTSETEDPNE